MATYSIPEDFIVGFENIIKLNESDLASLNSLIANLKINEPLDKIISNANDKFENISPFELQSIIRSLISIVSIFEEANNNIDNFTSEFSKSYSFSKNTTEQEVEALKSRLSLLLGNFQNISTSIRGQDLLTENQRTLRDCRIISDVRMLFDNEMLIENKYALIIHNLKIQYSENRQQKDFFVALDLSDLKKMKAIIDRAIEKDKIIKQTQHKFNFIDYNDASNSSS